MLLLAERGDDCSPLFFVDESGSPVRLEASDPGGTRAYFSPVRALAGDDPLSLTDILPTAFDHLVVDGRIARFGLSPRPGYYRRGDAGGAPALVELYPGCEVCTDGPTLREDQVVRAMVSRLRAERIFETRFRRLAADRSAAFVAESPYDRRLRGALRTFDRRFSTCDSVRTAAGRRDASVFALIRSLAMTLPWHVRHVWRGMMPEFVARAWGVKLDSRDAADRATAHGDTDSWGFPPAVSGTALDVHAFSFDGSSRHAFAFESDGGWVVMDFDRETYVPLAAYLRSADAYSLDTYETSRPEPGCLGA